MTWRPGHACIEQEVRTLRHGETVDLTALYETYSDLLFRTALTYVCLLYTSTRLIWHTQLAAHNGGDFFNEIFHAHPNLLTLESVMFHDLQKKFQETRADLKRQYGKQMPHLTDKDLLVSMLMGNEVSCQGLDRASRICPAVFFQPHFSNMLFTIQISGEKGLSTLYSEEYESIRTSPIFQGFKYIKTFTPMRRITTSYAATVRFMLKLSLIHIFQPQSKQNFLKRPLAAAAISGTRCWLTSSGFIWRLASTSSLPRQNTKREPLF